MTGSLALGLAQEKLAGASPRPTQEKQECNPGRERCYLKWRLSPADCGSGCQDRRLGAPMLHLSQPANVQLIHRLSLPTSATNPNSLGQGRGDTLKRLAFTPTRPGEEGVVGSQAGQRPRDRV